MTPSEAKKIIRAELDKYKIADVGLSARTVSFQDLARGQAVFVKLKNWKPNPLFNELKAIAHKNGFCVES